MSNFSGAPGIGDDSGLAVATPDTRATTARHGRTGQRRLSPGGGEQAGDLGDGLRRLLHVAAYVLASRAGTSPSASAATLPAHSWGTSPCAAARRRRTGPGWVCARTCSPAWSARSPRRGPGAATAGTGSRRPVGGLGSRACSRHAGRRRLRRRAGPPQGSATGVGDAKVSALTVAHCGWSGDGTTTAAALIRRTGPGRRRRAGSSRP